MTLLESCAYNKYKTPLEMVQQFINKKVSKNFGLILLASPLHGRHQCLI